MQDKYIKINNLRVSEKLSDFVNDELLKNTNVSAENFWLGLEKTLFVQSGEENSCIHTKF